TGQEPARRGYPALRRPRSLDPHSSLTTKPVTTDEQLDTVGFSQYPYGSDPDDPFITVLSGANLEFIHHMAEIALLRDLWQARFTTRG
ncbi:hypothetical protein ACFV9O_27675, partial [Streptomyces sp. NPDC059909]